MGNAPFYDLFAQAMCNSAYLDLTTHATQKATLWACPTVEFTSAVTASAQADPESGLKRPANWKPRYEEFYTDAS
jgi:hypothetical protein